MYEVEVTVTDSGPGTPMTDTQNITVTVTDVAEGTDATVAVEFPDVESVRVELRADDGIPGSATGTRTDLLKNQTNQAVFANA